MCVDLLKQHGIPVTYKTKMPKEELIKEIPKHDGLVVRSDTKVTAEVIAAATNLRVVGRAGTGVDNIDLEAATSSGIIVLNTPGGNSISACELTCALIADLARNVSVACHSLKAGRWDRKLYAGSELQGKTLAVLGLGRIGREVATRMQAYGMRTIGFDPIVSKEDAASFNVEKMELEEIWPQADYITVHTPLIPQTRNMINYKVFNVCKKGVKVVNVARGGIICENGLLKALKEGLCGGAALDVFSEEPPKAEVTRELIEHPKVVATPHLGASTSEAQSRVAVEVAEQFIALADPASPYKVTGVVNAPVLGAALVAENGPWIALAQQLGVLAARLAGPAGPKATSVAVQTAGELLRRKTFLSTPVAAGMVAKPGVNLVNAPAIAKQAGIEVTTSHDDKPTELPCVRVAVGHLVLTGTVGAGGSSVLLAVNDARFGDAGVALGDNMVLVSCKDANKSVVAIATAASQTGFSILGLSVAVGAAGVWVLLRTAQPVAITVPGATVF